MIIDVEFDVNNRIMEVEFDAHNRIMDVEFVNTTIIDNTREPVIKPLTVTENGEYYVDSKTDGFNPVKVDVIGGNVAEYKGVYEVTPSVSEQILETSRKVMRENLKVKEIPYAEVSNASGGNTITIG